MGQLVDGKWRSDDVFAEADGRFKRKESRFRNWVTADGEPGPDGEGGYGAEPGRYHLYVSLACPWAHRTLIMRRFKGLEEMIDVSTVHWVMRDDGWTFRPGPGVTGDPIHGADFLHQVYTAADPDYTGKVTVPVLWDRQRGTIVSNESAEIIRMFNSAFDGVGATAGDYYPEALRPEIDAVNERVYATLNNGVYRAGFATKQDAYEEAVGPLFDTLDWLEQRLEQSEWLTGDRLTEADIRLFTTLIRFDLVYHGHFKCNLRRIVDYPALWRYLRAFHALPGVADTVNVEHIKRHYYESHRQLNPSGVVPVGPAHWV
ncbi:MAG: glutathione S-transferase family protein [Alphaproteobacteria bacterium]|nr:glutathione S-transferase family protein [Alphaproteobacteria bacterium]MBU2271098.1 glutathione S-transferase family protein [Alphaproteobacteria bacterium]MBU2417800.1 glutathione S-transferase family protein [Alphaproteobacteria bacterium]